MDETASTKTTEIALAAAYTTDETSFACRSTVESRANLLTHAQMDRTRDATSQALTK